ncbi:unnamed protein product [Brassica oleracea]
MVIDPPLLTALPTESSSDHVNPLLSAISSNSPNPIPRPSLKRSRSSPNFTPSSSLNPNPFVHQSTDPVEALAFLSNPLTPIFSTRPPTENPNSSLDFLHLVPRLTSESQLISTKKTYDFVNLFNRPFSGFSNYKKVQY